MNQILWIAVGLLGCSSFAANATENSGNTTEMLCKTSNQQTLKISVKKERTTLGAKAIVTTGTGDMPAEVIHQSETTLVIGADPKVLRMAFNTYTRLGTARMADKVVSIDCGE